MRLAPLALLCCLPLLTPAPAAAAGPARLAPGGVESGYWWLPEPITGLIPTPGVPAGGLYVASAPTGTQAVAAVGFDDEAPDSKARLTLHVARLTGGASVAIVAMPISTTWQTGGPQPWSARPAYSGAGIRCLFDASRRTLTMTLNGREAAGGVLLLPAAKRSGAGLPGTFSVAFTPPRQSDVTVVGHSASPTPPAPVTSSPQRPTRSPSTGKPSATASSSTRAHHPSPSPHGTTSSRGPRPSPSSRPSGAAVTRAAASPSGSGHDARDAVLVAVAAALALAVAAAFATRRKGSPRS